MDTGDWTMRELIRRCLAEEPKAWNQFFSLTQPKIASAAYRRALWYTKSPGGDLIDDIVAETFAKLCFDDYRVLRIISDLPDHAVFGYLKRMAANLVTDWDRRRLDSINLEDADLPPDSSSPHKMATTTEFEEQCQLLRRELNGEPACERDLAIFRLRHQQGYSVPEITRIFQMKLKATENVIGRCLRILRDANKGKREEDKTEDPEKNESEEDGSEDDESGKGTSG
jgi:DNA-directed RNA polymerase specialized sigma24 family protein